MAIKAKPLPEGVPDHRRAFRNEATGNEWHVETEWREGQAGPNSVVVVQVLRPDGTPLEGTHSHTFTEEEQASPDFDPDAIIQAIVNERIGRSENILTGPAKLAGAMAAWKGKPKAARA